MRHLNFILALIAAFLLSLSELQAINDNGTSGRVFSTKLKSLLKMPAGISEKHAAEKVTVYFSVDEQGNVNEVFVTTANKDVKKDVEQQFRHFNFKGLKPCVVNSVVINFVVY